MQKFKTEKLTELGKQIFGDVLSDICFLFDDNESLSYQKYIAEKLTSDDDTIIINGIGVQIDLKNGKIVFFESNDWALISTVSQISYGSPF